MSIIHKYKYLFLIFSGLLLWAFYATYAPGGEFYGIYRLMILHPEEYQTHSYIFNPPWLFPILAPFEMLPGRLGFILYLILPIVSIIFVTKILKGNVYIALFSAQMFWVLWWGQIDWIGILGVGLTWLAYKKNSWLLMGLGILLVAIKPQIGLLAVTYLWFQYKEKWKTAAFVFVFFLISLLIWGLWPLKIIDNILNYVDEGSFAFWNSSLGLIGLPLFFLLFIKKPIEDKFLAIIAITLIVSPYLPYYSTLVLLCFPLPVGLYIFAFSGYSLNLLGPTITYQALVLLPMSVLIKIYWLESSNIWKLGKHYIQRLINPDKAKETIE